MYIWFWLRLVRFGAGKRRQGFLTRGQVVAGATERI